MSIKMQSMDSTVTHFSIKRFKSVWCFGDYVGEKTERWMETELHDLVPVTKSVKTIVRNDE